MGSKNAKAAAREVLETLGSGKKVVLGKILKKQGYSDNTADNPKNVTETKSYKEIVDPIVERWRKEIERIQTTLESKHLKKERYKDLVDSIDKLNKQVQLATGGVTERIAHKITAEEREVADKALNSIE